MTLAGVAALRAERDALVWFSDQVAGDEAFWALPSRCDGWSRLDVVRHLTTMFLAVLGEPPLPVSQSPTMTVGDYVASAAPALDELAAIQEPVVGEKLMAYSPGPDRRDAEHQRHLWADRLVYEHLCHRSIDLDGGAVLYDSVAPAAGWVLASLGELAHGPMHEALRSPVAIDVAFPVEAMVTFCRVGDGIGMQHGSATAEATIGVTAESFILCASGRAAWTERATISGDDALARAVAIGMRIEA